MIRLKQHRVLWTTITSTKLNMDFFNELPMFYVLAALIPIATYLFYLAILPKPLPGIPYNTNAASNPLGDIPEMMRYVLRTKRIFVTASLNRMLLTCYLTNDVIVLAHLPHHPP